MPKRSLLQYLTRHSFLLSVIAWSKKNSLPGFKRIPLYHLLTFIRDELKNNDLLTRANGIAFNLFLSIFPAIIVLFTLLAYTPLYDAFDEVLAETIERIMPGSAGQLILSTIEDIATRQRSGLLSLSFLLAIWFASNGLLSLMEGFEKEHHLTFRRRSYIEKRLVAIQLTFLLGLVLIGDVILVILGNLLLGALFAFIKAGLLTRLAFLTFRWVVIIALFYAGFSIIYRYGAATKRPLPFFNPGASLATALSLLVSWGFSFYVDNFSSYNKIYGSIGALMAFLIWLQLNCAILLIGFELNAGIAVLRDRRRAQEEKPVL
jgi:Predicted membrane protein